MRTGAAERPRALPLVAGELGAPLRAARIHDPQTPSALVIVGFPVGEVLHRKVRALVVDGELHAERHLLDPDAHRRSRVNHGVGDEPTHH